MEGVLKSLREIAKSTPRVRVLNVSDFSTWSGDPTRRGRFIGTFPHYNSLHMASSLHNLAASQIGRLYRSHKTGRFTLLTPVARRSYKTVLNLNIILILVAEWAEPDRIEA